MQESIEQLISALLQFNDLRFLGLSSSFDALHFRPGKDARFRDAL